MAPEEHVGRVKHYWPKAGAAEIELENIGLQVGDEVRIEGHGHSYVQRIDSLQVNHEPRGLVLRGEPAAIGVHQPVHRNDDVYIRRPSGPKE